MKDPYLLQIKILSFDSYQIDLALSKIKKKFPFVNINVGALPTKVQKYTVLRSPFVHKKSREQFEIRQFKKIFGMSFNDLNVMKKCITYCATLSSVSVQMKVHKKCLIKRIN